jgi:hypothetical protein
VETIDSERHIKPESDDEGKVLTPSNSHTQAPCSHRGLKYDDEKVLKIYRSHMSSPAITNMEPSDTGDNPTHSLASFDCRRE